MSRNKGGRGERELAKLLVKYGFSAQRTPYSGAGTLKGDLIARDMAACIPGFHIECKRVEKLDLPKAIRQSWADSGANIPTVFHRRNDTRTGDPVAKWHVTLPAEDFLADQAELREMRRLWHCTLEDKAAADAHFLALERELEEYRKAAA